MTEDIRICFVGDSFVNGTGDETTLGWTGRICAAANADNFSVTHYNLGVRRNTSRDILLRWEHECALRLPDTCDCRIVFSCGVNDTVIEDGKLRVETPESCANVRNLLENADRYEVLMVGPPPVSDPEQNERISMLSSVYYETTQGLGVPYVDLFSHLIMDDTISVRCRITTAPTREAKGIRRWRISSVHQQSGGFVSAEPVRVRPARADDAVELVALARLFDPNGASGNITSVQASLDENPTETVLVAEQNQQLVGYASIQIARSFAYFRVSVELTGLYVREKSRRQGVASCLVREVISRCRALHALELYLRVNMENHGAIRFYERSGLHPAAHLEYRVKYYDETNEA